MDLSKPSTLANLEAAFGGESMANRKYLFFADVAKKLGHPELAKLFRDTAAQETEHAFAHFRLLHPELVVSDPAALSDDEKQTMLRRCLSCRCGAPPSGPCRSHSVGAPLRCCRRRTKRANAFASSGARDCRLRRGSLWRRATPTRRQT